MGEWVGHRGWREEVGVNNKIIFLCSQLWSRNGGVVSRNTGLRQFYCSLYPGEGEDNTLLTVCSNVARSYLTHSH